jgi:phosphoglycolate phosphatase
MLIFDLDGTLVDSRADLATAANLTRADYGLPALSVATITGYVGNGIEKLVRRSLQGAEYDLAEAVRCQADHYQDHLVDQTTLYPGVAEALENLRCKGHALAVVTNKPEAMARVVLRHFRLDAYLAAVVGGDSCPVLKPHPEPIFEAQRQLGLSKTAGWIIGDNWTDLEAGKAAGLQCCFCRYGFGQARGATPDLVIGSLAEFADFLKDQA